MGRPALDRPSLIAREAQLVQLDALARRAASGDGAVAYLDGPAGIGKSALLASASTRLAAQGFRVLSAVGSPLEREFPFGLVRQLMLPVLRDPDAPTGIPDGVARLAEVPLGLAGDEAGRAGVDAATAIDGLFWLIVELAGSKPLLLTVDDAHWADPMSLRLVSYLARRLDGLPILLIVASRPADESEEEVVLRGLQALPQTALVRPSPLTDIETGRLIDACGFGPGAHPDFVSACHHATGGVPLLLVELARKLKSDGFTGTEAEAHAVTAIAPETLSTWVLGRLGALGRDAHALASAYAILGEAASLKDAAALAGLRAGDAGTAADALITARILAPGRPHHFIHPIVRTAVYESLPPVRRAESHRQAARLADADGAPAALVGAHLLASEPSGDAWTVDVLRRAAADSVASGALPAAVKYLERAIEEVPALAARGQLLAELGAVQQHTSLPDAVRSMRAALELERDQRCRAEIHLTLGKALFTNGAYAQARAEFVRGVAEISDVSDDLAVELSAWSVVETTGEPDFAPAVQTRVEALLHGSSPGATRIDRLLLAFLAARGAQTGERRADVVADLACRALADGALLADCAEDSTPFGGVCTGLLAAGRFVAARAELTRAIASDRTRRSRRAVAWLSYLRGVAAYCCGDLVNAVADLEEACRAYEEVAEIVPVDVRAFLAVVMVDRADLDAARQLLTSLRRDAERGVRQRAAIRYHFAVGRLQAAEGDLTGALETYLMCEPYAREIDAQNTLPWRLEAAQLALRLGDDTRAREVFGDSLERARAFGSPPAVGMSLRMSGMIEGGQRGIELLEDAISTLQGTEAKLQLARTLMEYGSVLRRAGLRGAAIDTLKTALDAAVGCGGLALASQAREELVIAGARPRRERVAGPAALTPGEMRVAEMAAAGSTNQQIAQAKYLTLRTVETHLTAAYRKLGIAGRNELAGVLAA